MVVTQKNSALARNILAKEVVTDFRRFSATVDTESNDAASLNPDAGLWHLVVTTLRESDVLNPEE